jgi:hypothetical protein
MVTAGPADRPGRREAAGSSHFRPAASFATVSVVVFGRADERLLVYNVSQGWVPLCAFLGISVPAKPYPKTNSTQFFIEDLAPIFNQAPQLQSE